MYGNLYIVVRIPWSFFRKSPFSIADANVGRHSDGS